MRVQTINGKKYILVIIDDYSRFTWVKFLRSKDETLEVFIKFLKQIQNGLNKTVRYIRTDNGTEFVNKVLTEYYESVGIFHQKTIPRTPQQNDVVERQNRTLVEAARTMLIFSKAPMFLWAEAVATAFFGALCYLTNNSEVLGKLQPTADIGIFVGYAPSRKGYRIYNKRTRRIMETIHVQFDELTEQTALVHSSLRPTPNLLMPGPISSGLVPNPAPAIPYIPPTNKELELLFQPMFDEYFTPPGDRQVPTTNADQVPVNLTGLSISISCDQDAPSGSHLTSSSDHQSSSVHHGVVVEQTFEVNPFSMADPEPFVNVFAPNSNSKASSSGTASHPVDNIIGKPSRPISTRKQLAIDALANIGIRNTAYLRDLMMEISQINLSVDEDTCTWSLDDDGIFSVRSSRRLIDSKLIPSILSSTSWDNILSRKVNIFLWRLSLDRLPHRLNLLSCGIEIPTISCSSCNGNVESVDHIFFAYDLVKEVWSLVRKWCDLSIPPFASYDAWKRWICSWHAPKVKSRFKDAVGGFFAWPKDQVVFDPKATPPSTIQMNVENKTAPNLHSKRKNVYVSSDAMQRQAKKKSLQKSLNY
ncbi:retrovirus-related pol polyprotein from transposon TNT 1-94 [Tanacetum coccineum]